MKPSGDRVLVKTAGMEQQTKSGFVLPKVAQKKRTEGEITAIADAKEVKVQAMLHKSYSGIMLYVYVQHLFIIMM